MPLNYSPKVILRTLCVFSVSRTRLYLHQKYLHVFLFPTRAFHYQLARLNKHKNSGDSGRVKMSRDKWKSENMRNIANELNAKYTFYIIYNFLYRYILSYSYRMNVFLHVPSSRAIYHQR